MAFSGRKTSKVSVASAESLFHDLRNRSVEGLLTHQGDMLRRYQKEAFDESNVALELPTGSGKTLVGLLIAEFRRVTKGERVLYLCPTKQLVRQVVEQSEKKYGIKATAFTGKIRDFEPADKANYNSAKTIAVAPYSALFNINPFFTSPQLILLDDAHSAENYVSSAWSLDINRYEHKDFYLAVLASLKKHLSYHSHGVFENETVIPRDSGWVEKIPSPILRDIEADLSAIIDTHTVNTDLKYPWSLLKGNLTACHLYVGHRSILLRPIIPPSMTHKPFADATQRICMSATLGRGGDLERVTGLSDICRLPIPAGWDKQGIGRRFFMFPEQSLKPDAIDGLLIKLIKRAGRALILTPSEPLAEPFRKLVKETLKLPLFGASDIEVSKTPFIRETKAVAVLANRYDGIDLLGDECRLLIIRGLPRAANLQERYFMSRLAAGNLLDDRIRTRIIQAVGRCTRSATDFAAIVILGDDFDDWLVLSEKRSLFHPELQAELKLGLDESADKKAADFIENLDIFLARADEWKSVDDQILELRNEADQEKIDGEELLMKSAALEVKYIYAIWSKDFAQALKMAQEATAVLAGDDVKGFRGFWNYLTGSAALELFSSTGKDHLRVLADEQFARAAACTPSIDWLRRIGKKAATAVQADIELATECLESNISFMELTFEASGYASPKKFEAHAKEIIEGLSGQDAKNFEAAHVRLGELLGFQSGNSCADAAPDPWWISAGKLCIVSEDKSDSKPENAVAIKHVRQAVGHPAWVKAHLTLEPEAQIACVMITPAKTNHPEVATFAGSLGYWQIEDFRKWAVKAVGVLREVRSEYPGPGNVDWRTATATRLKATKLDPMSLYQKVTSTKVIDLPVHTGKDE